jgi:hypothetical protein
LFERENCWSVLHSLAIVTICNLLEERAAYKANDKQKLQIKILTTINKLDFIFILL